MLFRTGTHVEGWRVDELGTNTNVALINQDTRVVNGLGQALLVHLGLQTSLQQLLRGQLQDRIQFEFVIRQETETIHATQERGTFKNALGVVRFERQKGARRLAQFGQGKLDAPNLALASQAVFADELELGIQTLLFVRTTWCLEGLAVCSEWGESGG